MLGSRNKLHFPYTVILADSYLFAHVIILSEYGLKLRKSMFLYDELRLSCQPTQFFELTLIIYLELLSTTITCQFGTNFLALTILTSQDIDISCVFCHTISSVLYRKNNDATSVA